MLTTENLSVFSKDEIVNIALQHVGISRNIRAHRATLVDFVLGFDADSPLIHDLQEAVVNKERAKEQSKNERLAAKRRRQQERIREANKRRKTEEALAEEDTSRYLELPTAEEVKACYAKFYHATSSGALIMGVCGVCARQQLDQDARFSIIPLSDVPNSSRLYPRIPHPAHDIYEGMLLEPAGVIEVEGDMHVRICCECLTQLRKDSDKPPEKSLANNLWVGKIPWQLLALTVPECQLIARAHPSAYVYKLYSKTLSSRTVDGAFQRGIRGNVTTYALDVDGMVDMVMGRMLPRPPTVLPSLISITFFGRGKLPKSRLRNLFKVRRQAVREALLWLKANNPYYADVDIDEDALALLPEDDVPTDLYDVMRQSEDVGVVEEERAGYVNEDDEGEHGGYVKSTATNTFDF